MKDRGRRIALAGTALAIMVLAVLGFAAKGQILEEWYLHDIANCQSSQEERSRTAARWLGEHGSERALSRLIYLVRTLASRPDAEAYGSGANNSLVWIGKAEEAIVDRRREQAVPLLVSFLAEEPPRPIPGNQVRIGAATFLSLHEAEERPDGHYFRRDQFGYWLPPSGDYHLHTALLHQIQQVKSSSP